MYTYYNAKQIYTIATNVNIACFFMYLFKPNKIYGDYYSFKKCICVY